MSLKNSKATQRTGFPFPRFSDRELVEKVREFIDESKLNLIKANYHISFADQTVTYEGKLLDAALQEILDLDTITVFKLNLELSATVFVSIDRKWDSGNRVFVGSTDYLTIQSGDASALAVARLIALARKRFDALDQKSFHDSLEEGTRELYLTREKEISRLERLQESFISKLTSFELTQRKKNASFRRRMEKLYAERHAALDIQHQERISQLEQKEANLKQIREELDERENRQARRDIYKDIKGKLTARSTNFVLSPQTQWRMRWTLVTILVFVAIFAALFGYCFYRNVSAGTSGINWVALGSQVASGIAFVATATFFIRWMNRWFQSHAQEEFRFKTLELDIDRASWLVELAMEWKNITKAEIPPELLEKLGGNLFAIGSSESPDIHPAETLFGSVLGKNGRLSIEPGKVLLERGAKSPPRA